MIDIKAVGVSIAGFRRKNNLTQEQLIDTLHNNINLIQLN